MSISRIIQERKCFHILALTSTIVICSVVIVTITILHSAVATGPLLVKNVSVPQLGVGNQPTDIAIDPFTNTAYVVNSRSNTVSVIQFPDNLTTNVDIENIPFFATYSPGTNTIYVTNTHSNTVSVIDTFTNKIIDTIKVGSFPIGLDWNIRTSELYIVNSHSNTTSVLDRYDVLEKTIKVGGFPEEVAVNQNTGMVYVTNLGSNTVTVINGNTKSIVGPIQVGKEPYGIAVNSRTNMTYVANEGSNTISVINGHNIVTKEIPVGYFPQQVAVNQNTGMVYVTNRFSNTVSIIDGNKESIVANVQVGKEPYGITVNPNTGMVYVTNLGSNTISIINGKTHLTESAVTFGIVPKNSGIISCNGRKITNSTILYDDKTIVNCEAIANSIFPSPFRSWSIIPPTWFSSWSGNLVANDSTKKDHVSFKANRYGTLIASFSVLSEGYITLLLGIAVTVLLTIGGWLAKNWFYRSRHRRYFEKYMRVIRETYNRTYRNKDECLQGLGDLRMQIIELFANSTIKESDYEKLNKTISQYLEELTKDSSI